jgi:uncharacterized Tic20 family protein
MYRRRPPPAPRHYPPPGGKGKGPVFRWLQPAFVPGVYEGGVVREGVRVDRDNYGIQEERDLRIPQPTGLMSPADERSWSALAHLSAYLNIFTGFLGPVAAFVVWLVYRERSSVVARHAMRAVIHQSVWLAVLFIGWSATLFLTAFVIGIVFWPVMGLLTLGFFAHASYEAYRAYTDVRSIY